MAKRDNNVRKTAARIVVLAAFSPKHGILTMENLTQKKQNRKFWKL